MNLFNTQPLSSVPDKSEVIYDGRVVEFIYASGGKATMFDPADIKRGIFYLHDTTEVRFVRKL